MSNFNNIKSTSNVTSFTIRDKKDVIVFNYCLMVLLLIGGIFMFIYRSVLVVEFYWIYAVLFISISAMFAINVLWKVTVDETMISVKRLGCEKSYLISQINKMNFTNRSTYVLYIDDKKIFEVSVFCQNIVPFLDKFSQIKMDVYVDNKRVEIDSIMPEVLCKLRPINRS